MESTNTQHELTTQEVLSRGVADIKPSTQGLASLMGKRKIRLYLGIDPTGNQLHLGHMVVLRKLQQFADLGHEVILLIGNGTVKIGDPTGKDKTRPMLTEEQIDENFKTWKAQASKVLNFSKIKIMRNGDWLDKLTMPEIIKLMAKTTVQQLLERDMFQERIKNDLPIYSHELIYPLLQGYDSVEMNVDLEIGGNDQIFNMMVGRQLQKIYNNKDKYVLGTPLLIGTDGRKMGKSYNNFISLTAEANDLYGKLMSVVDDVILEYFTLLTNVSLQEIENMRKALADKLVNPMELKKVLAFTLTEMLHDTKAAKEAAEHFERTVQKKEVGEKDTQPLPLASSATVLDATMATGIVTSRSDGKRLIEQGAVQKDGEKFTDPNAVLNARPGNILRVGKFGYFKIEEE